jgi:HD domain
MRTLPRCAQVYVCGVLLLGVLVVAYAATLPALNWAEIAMLAGLYWIGDCAPVTTKLGPLTISTSFPVAVAAVLLVGPWSASIVCIVGALARTQREAWFKRAFNGAQMALCAVAAGYTFQWFPAGGHHAFVDARFPAVLPAVIVAGLAYFVLNYLLVGVAISITTGMRLSRIWWGGMSEVAAPSLGYGLIGLMIAVLWSGGVGAVAGLLVLAPMLIARWAFQQYAAQHQAYEATVSSLIQAVETKDYYTRGHSERVSKASVIVAQQLGMREDRLEMLRYAGMLHDVGKLGVPTKLLQKTGPLDDEEFASIKLHPTRGFDMVSGISFLEEAMMGIRHHHERVDGRGYPDGLVGDAIPEFARIIAVADAFDSMTSTRSYRGARSVEAAMGELQRWAGTQFDVVMVDALVQAIGASGWEASVDATDEIVDPSMLVFRDHDDPTAGVSAAFRYGGFGVPDEQQVS